MLFRRPRAKLAGMSTTYVAWNGQSYPWPPPDGWYEGSDGRWWAPGSGPEAARTARSTTATSTSTSTKNISNEMPERFGVRAETTEPDADSTDGGQVTVLTGAARKSLPRFDETLGHRPEPEAAPDRQPTTDHRRHRRSVAPLILAGLVVFVLVAGGLGFLAVRDNNSTDTSTSPNTTAVDDQASIASTAIGSEARTTPPPTAPPSTAQAPTTDSATTGTTTTATTAATAIGPEVQDRTETWRAELDAEGINTSQVTDADIAAFGNAFCVFALVSVDLEEFDTFRNRALDGVAGWLTEDQLNTAINTAVTTFCPDEATRLGL